MKIRYSDRARVDIDSSCMWYNAKRPGLGSEFLVSMRRSTRLIMENPMMYPVWYANYRHCVMKRFPFSIVYSVEDTEIVVHAVFDDRQDPSKRP